ncbi:demethylmenaquinone methyltransferase [archaeon BMS3Bbin15]|nr:demethylmenaquinone methyltransferase [archaeon BMS3Bbin15]
MPEKKEILRVKGEIKKTYAKVSKSYSIWEGRFERKLRERALKFLDVQEGEIVLEIGFGTGFTLVEIAKSVGERSKAYGIDVTHEMVELAKERLKREELAGRVELSEGDARNMPYEDNMFDAVYMVGVLELFDTPDIPKVLKDIKRVLKPDGRLVVASIEKEGHENSKFLRLYEWVHRKFPKIASCRPIYVEDSIRDAGYKTIKTDEMMLSKLFPMKFVVAST